MATMADAPPGTKASTPVTRLRRATRAKIKPAKVLAPRRAPVKRKRAGSMP